MILDYFIYFMNHYIYQHLQRLRLFRTSDTNKMVDYRNKYSMNVYLMFVGYGVLVYGW